MDYDGSQKMRNIHNILRMNYCCPVQSFTSSPHHFHSHTGCISFHANIFQAYEQRRNVYCLRHQVWHRNTFKAHSPVKKTVHHIYDLSIHPCCTNPVCSSLNLSTLIFCPQCLPIHASFSRHNLCRKLQQLHCCAIRLLGHWEKTTDKLS